MTPSTPKPATTPGGHPGPAATGDSRTAPASPTTAGAAARLRGLPSVPDLNPYRAPADELVCHLIRQEIDTTNLDEAGVLAWLLYLHRSAVELHGAGNPRSRQCGQDVADRARRYRPTVDPSARPVVMATAPPPRGGYAIVVSRRLDNAELLHEHGWCDTAADEAVAALQAWSRHHAGAPVVTYVQLIRTLQILDWCGRSNDAHTVLDNCAHVLPRPGRPWHDALAHTAARLRIHDGISRHRSVCAHPPVGAGYTPIGAAMLRHLQVSSSLPAAAARPRPTATLNDELVGKIVASYQRGASLRVVGRRYGFSASTIARVLAHSGVARRKTVTPSRAEDPP